MDKLYKNFGRLPWGAIGMLGLVLAGEQTVLRYEFHLVRPVPLNWAYARHAAVSRAPGCAILCLGSSIVKFGVGARVIEAQTGKRTFNLAMTASSLPANYFLLRRVIEAGARPEAVLVDCLDSNDGMDPSQIRDNLQNLPELLRFSEVLDLAWHARDADFLATMVLFRTMAACKNRFEIRNAVMAALRQETASESASNQLVVRNWRANRGTWVIPRNVGFEASHRGDAAPVATSARATAQRPTGTLNGTYKQRFLDLAANHGIKVFLLLPPLSPLKRQSMSETGADSENTSVARAMLAAYANLVVIDGRYSGYPIEAFYDDVHLNSKGASLLSSEVGALMQSNLSCARPKDAWLSLPTYRDEQPSLLLEDVSQTGVAAAREMASRR